MLLQKLRKEKAPEVPHHVSLTETRDLLFFSSTDCSFCIAKAIISCAESRLACGNSANFIIRSRVSEELGPEIERKIRYLSEINSGLFLKILDTKTDTPLQFGGIAQFMRVKDPRPH